MYIVLKRCCFAFAFLGGEAIQIAYVKRNNVSIHYKLITSQNPAATDTLVLIHGAGLDMHCWNFALPYFLQNYHVLVYDLRGHGASDTGNTPLNLTMLTDDLIFLIDKLAINAYHVIAHGFAGFIGVKHAENHPKSLRTLTLMASPVYYPKQLGSEVIAARKKCVQAEDSIYPLGKNLVDQMCHPPTEEKTAILLEAYHNVSPAIYFKLFQNHFGKNAAQRLSEIRVPTLLLSGSEDDLYPPELFSASLHLYTNATHLILPCAAFMMQMDQPKLIAEWLHQFVKKNKEAQQKISVPASYRKKLTAELYTEMYNMLTQNSQPTVTELQVNIMNGFSVYLNGEPIRGSWGKRKAKQMLIYLAYQHSATRDELCDIFWPEANLKSARNSLRVSLHHLKHILEESSHSTILKSDKEHAYLRGTIQSDLLIHIEKIKAAHQLENDFDRAEAYKQLLPNTSDNPLPGLFEEWFLNLRTWIEQEWGAMALFLAEYYEKQQSYKEAIRYMKLALHFYNYDAYTMRRLEELEKRVKRCK